ncbi:MAG: NERD domain-containing protein [Clostridia bacterium]|nr:NERD domain-containing protein [Clostridia bacterium]
MVKYVVGETLENVQYVINNLIVDNNGATSQIDHIVINPRGVFVIETKNYSGEIYGSENQREWTQVLAYGNVKNKLYNPLKQNATHVYNVKKIVGNLPVYSLVVFAQNNTEHIEAKNVIPLSSLKSALSSGKSVLSQKQMESAYHLLLNNKVDISTEQHVENVRKQQWNVKHGICPRCGGDLVLRNGKYGTFWGCSNYPKCKFIKNEQEQRSISTK